MPDVKSALQRMLMPASIRRLVAMNGLITGAWLSQAVYVVAKLRIADVLGSGTRDVADIAAAVDANENALYRILRALSDAGVVREVQARRFELTTLGMLLRSDWSPSLRAWAMYEGEEWHWRPWGDLLYSVRTGRPAMERYSGGPSFEFLARNPEAGKIFDDAMADLATVGDVSVVTGYDFSRFQTIVDVGGGNGALLISLLQAYAKLQGILFETQAVLENARPKIETAGLSDRCELRAGDFFAGVPAGAEAYVLKQVLHDWDDEQAAQLLRNCRAAMSQSARLLIIEIIVTPAGKPSLAKLTDLEMLVMTGGRERTLAEYRALLESAGLRIRKVHPTRSPFSIMEAATTFL